MFSIKQNRAKQRRFDEGAGRISRISFRNCMSESLTTLNLSDSLFTSFSPHNEKIDNHKTLNLNE